MEKMNRAVSSKTLYDLPLEVMDMILLKSYLHWSLNSPTKQRDEEVIRSLMSVAVFFNRRITRKLFKKAISRYLKVVCPISINFTQRIDFEDEWVQGVTRLRNEIYVLCRSHSYGPNVIRVFEEQNQFRLQNRIKLENIIINPSDIESSEKENCLYIADHRGECVWKVTKEKDDQYRTIKWIPTDHRYGAPFPLSKTNDDQLMMIDRPFSKLMIYGSDAELIRSIQLPKDVEHPLHAVETSIGNFIVLYKWTIIGYGYVIEDLGYGISEVTRDGQVVIRRFIPSNETQKLSGPHYLALDSDDRVLVADTYNDRVILLDSDLKWNRILCPTKEEEQGTRIRGPGRLCYDKEKKKLIVVGGNRGNGFSVYTLSRN